jgi:cobalt-zinc-cadmium efflux system membrane fusion protein
MNPIHQTQSLFRLLKLLTITSFFAGLAFSAFAAEDEHQEGEHEEEDHTEFAEISTAMAAEQGIRSATVSSGELELTLQLFGRTTPDPQLVSHVTARYPGMIREIVPELGDTVEAGEVIATIEANNSLQTYQIRAPISGTVVDKHANPGEQAMEQTLMTIANYERLWVDFTVFPGDTQHVKAGLNVHVTMDHLSADGRISYLNPSQSNSPTLIARVPLDNPQGLWSPGLLVEGQVVTEQASVDLLVDNNAIQLFEGGQVVFVQEGDHYYPRPLVLGRSDGRFTEVLDGLSAGESYVVENSYLIKADLEKEGVEHDH